MYCGRSDPTTRSIATPLWAELGPPLMRGRVRLRLAVAGLKVVMVASMLVTGGTRTASAQNCKKGIRCGHTCISASRTCQITTAPEQGNPSVSNLEPRAAGAPSPQALDAAQPTTEPSAATHPYVALTRGSFYYRRSCSGAIKLLKGQDGFPGGGMRLTLLPVYCRAGGSVIDSLSTSTD